MPRWILAGMMVLVVANSATAQSGSCDFFGLNDSPVAPVSLGAGASFSFNPFSWPDSDCPDSSWANYVVPINGQNAGSSGAANTGDAQGPIEAKPKQAHKAAKPTRMKNASRRTRTAKKPAKAVRAGTKVRNTVAASDP